MQSFYPPNYFRLELFKRFHVMPSFPLFTHFGGVTAGSLNRISSSSRRWLHSLLLLWCCCYCLLLCASGASDAAPLQMLSDGGGEQFEREDRDYRPLQFGKRESYRPLQFGKRTVGARGLFVPSAVAPSSVYGATLVHNGGLEEFDPTMGQYIVMAERRK